MSRYPLFALLALTFAFAPLGYSQADDAEEEVEIEAAEPAEAPAASATPTTATTPGAKASTSGAKATTTPAPAVEKKSMSLDEQLEAIDADSSKRRTPSPPPAGAETDPLADEGAVLPAAKESNAGPSVGAGFYEPVGDKHSWYRSAGEWIASRTVREGLVGDEPVSKVLTDGKRFDLSIGKRIPVFTFQEESLTRAWSVGFDGGMAVSLFRRSSNASNVTFASENFDGFFGFYLARAIDDTIIMYRLGHISAHLVDNNPRVTGAIPYSRFWNEIIVSQTLATVTSASPWDVHLQGAGGLNFKSVPNKHNPRWLAGIDIGRNIGGPASWAIVSTFDARHSGVRGQKNNYSVFLGLGRLRRPETANRPVKFGVSHHWGSDYRNQYFNRRQKFTAFEIQVDL